VIDARRLDVDVFDGHAVLALICTTYRLDFAELVHDLVDAALQGGAWVFAPLLGLEWYSTRFLQVLGLEPGKVPHLPELWQERIDPGDRTRSLLLYAEHVRSRGGIKYDLPATYIRPDGRAVRVRCIGEVERWSSAGEPQVMVGRHVELEAL